MSVIHLLKADFSKGEVTPLVYARQDQEFYGAGMSSLENFLVLKYGGLRRRSGTRFVGTVKDQSKKTRIIPFIFSDTQALFLEFGHEYFRIWTPTGGQVLNGLGTDILEYPTPYDSDDLDGLQFSQYGDTIFIAHTDYAPMQVRRFLNTTWIIELVPFTDGPYLTINDTAVTVTANTTLTAGTSRTLTWSSITAINDGAGFTAADIGRHVRVSIANKWAWGKITAVNSTVQVVIDVIESAITTNAATLTWRLGMQCESQGYFGCVANFKGRTAWARTKQNPRTVAFSFANLPYRFTPSALGDSTVTDENGFTVPITSGSADDILWMQERTQLIVGTASGIRIIKADDNTGTFGPRNYVERMEVASGTIAVQPVQSGSSTIHAGRFGLSVNDLFYDYQVDGLVAPPMSTLSEHLFRRGIKSMAYAKEPSSVVWVLTTDGKLVGMTADQYSKSTGFHPHDVRGEVESIAVIPDYENRRDVLMLVVKRTINTEVTRYVEILQPEFGDLELTAKEDAWFVDSGVRYEGSPISVVTGVDHLKAETVTVYADGAVYPNAVVSQDGEVVIPNGRTASKVLVGLPMTARAIGLRTPLDLKDGAQLGLPKIVKYVVVDLYQTSGVRVGSAANDLRELLVKRKPSDPTNTAPPLYTGAVRVAVQDTYDNEGQLELICDQPLPTTILAVNVAITPQP